MGPQTRVVEMPADLDLRWDEGCRRTFKGAEEAWALWHEWLGTNRPSPEQAYRKLLMDLFFDYRTAHHLGDEFDTNDPAYDEFNRCTGAPITSMDDYVARILVLLDYKLDHRGGSPAEIGAATFRFIVTGDPSAQP